MSVNLVSFLEGFRESNKVSKYVQAEKSRRERENEEAAKCSNHVAGEVEVKVLLALKLVGVYLYVQAFRSEGKCDRYGCSTIIYIDLFSTLTFSYCFLFSVTYDSHVRLHWL